MPCPSFPAEDAALIGRAILAKVVRREPITPDDLSLFAPAGRVLAYGLCILGENVKPTFGAGIDDAESAVSEQDAAKILIDAGEKPEGEGLRAGADDGRDVEGAIPWAVVIPIIFQLVSRILKR